MQRVVGEAHLPFWNMKNNNVEAKLISHTWASAEIFPRGGNVDIFPILFRILWRCNANECSQNTLPFFLFHKENGPCYNSQKTNFVGSNSQAYYDNLHNRLSADFPSRALLFKEALPWYLTKLQIVTLFCLARLVIAT